MRVRWIILVLVTSTIHAQYFYPFQNPTLSTDTRLDDLLSRLTVQEKVSQLFIDAPAIERLNIPAYYWWNEALHGVARAGKATVFPQAIGLAATFDEDLMLRVGTAISDEGRAKHNFFVANGIRSIYTGLTFWSPNINIFRDPRWGRGQETYGEDPYLTGRMTVNFVRGLQGDDPKYFKSIATVKHYAVHSGPEYSRHSDNFFVNNRDLYETYLPAFKMAVKEAQVQSVMCAYNRLRDQPCCSSHLLLSQILRQQFGFNGYVVSDCGAITDIFNSTAHHMVPGSTRAWGWALNSGTDLNCENYRDFLHSNLDSALQAGIINLAEINLAVRRLFAARMRLGLLDPPGEVPFNQIPLSVVGSVAHQQLALEAAQKSLVLLKNNGILPLKPNLKVALIGPNADNFAILLGNYNGNPVMPITPLQALRQKLGDKLIYAYGCPLVPGLYTNYTTVPSSCLWHNEKGQLRPGLQAEYFTNNTLTGTPALSRVDEQIDFVWDKSPLNQKVEDLFSVRWLGLLKPSATGTYLFDDHVEVLIDGKKVPSTGILLANSKTYPLEVRLLLSTGWWKNNIEPQARLSWSNISRNYTQEALEAADQADVIVFCGGLSPDDLEGEESPLNIPGFQHGDRTDLYLPAIQEQLLYVLKKPGKPLVLVNFSGSAVALNWASEHADAIVQGFYPGEKTGTALRGLLFGEFSPSGRLPFTVYRSAHDLPDFKNYAMEGRTYRFFRGSPLWSFGFGLSYTQFNYSELIIKKEQNLGDVINLAVQVENSGPRDGEEVVQVYLTILDASVPVPSTTLVGFKRVFLRRNENKTIHFTLFPEQFSLVNEEDKLVLEPHQYRITVGPGAPPIVGAKSAEITLKGPKRYIQ